MAESTKLADALAALDLGADVAEFHGGICGLLCMLGPGAVPIWVRESTDSPSSPTGDAPHEMLHEAEAESWRELDGPDLAFYPLLPDAEHDLADRVIALASWCHGFLTGLGLGGFRVSADETQAESPGNDAQLAEIVADFAEISRATLGEGELESANLAGFDLEAVIEYVRVGVQLIFEELRDQRDATDARRMH